MDLVHRLRNGKWIWELVCVFLAYVAAGEIGLSIPFTSGNVSPLWPPAGVALAATLLCGFRVWPAVTLGAYVVNYFSDVPHLAAVGIAIGNTLGPLCGAWLLLHLSEFQPSLTRLRDVLGVILCGALGGTAVSATIGAGVLFLTGVNAWSGFGSALMMWWLGDSMGVVIVTPLALTFRGILAVRGESRRIELACLLLGAVGSAVVIFDPHFRLMRPDVFAFGLFPFVLWGAIRFEAAGAAIVSFLVAAIAVWGTANGFGPFVKGEPLQNATLLDSFLGVTSVSGMILAAVVAERAQLIREQSSREALERSEEIYRGIVETAYEGIWKIDADFNTSFVNKRMTELLGYSIEEMIGRPLFDFLFESDIEQKRADLQRRRLGISEQLDARYRKKDGSALWARVATSPIIGADGAFQGALAMISDITEQKRIAVEVCRSQEMITLLSQAVEQTADSVVITDREGKIEYVNPAFNTMTGYSREEAVGNTPRMLKSGLQEEMYYDNLWNQNMLGGISRGTLINRKKSGELFWTEQTITPIKDDSGTITHFVSVLKDITTFRKQQEQEVQLSMAREVQQRFYAGAAIKVAEFDIASAAYPAEETGGDYLDLFSTPNGRICIGVGDVSGHGLASALVMAMTRAYVRSFAQVESDLGKILSRVNHMLISDLENNRFVTLLLVSLDALSGRLSYASAGHIPGLLVNASGEVNLTLESSGPPLGLFDDSHYCSSAIKLKSQQLLVLLTDGVTEMTDSEDLEFGSNGVLDYIRSHRQESTRDLAEGICRAAQSFGMDNYPQADDLTDVIVRVA